MDNNGTWVCSVCTYKNIPAAFKCEICDTRKGTSTRKPRVTATMVAQQIISSFPPLPLPTPPNHKYQRSNSGGKRPKRSGGNSVKLKNLDRENGREIPVTVNGVTITVTDYKLLPKTDDDNDEQTRPVDSDEIINDIKVEE